MKTNKLDKLVNEQVDYLLDNYFIQESFTGKVLKILGFITGTPKDRKFQAYQKQYHKCVQSCIDTYTDEKTTYNSKKDAYSNLDEAKEKDFKETEKQDEQLIKENPEKARCITRCRVTFLRNIVNIIKDNEKDICEKNKFKDECYEWIEDNLPDIEAELEYLEKAVTKISKIKNDKQIQSMIKKVGSNLVKTK